MERLIIVIYIGVAGLRSEDIPDFTKKVTGKIAPNQFEGELIIIPVQSSDTRIECINPKYITKKELIEEHTELMKKLNEQLHTQLEIIKEEEKNEK